MNTKVEGNIEPVKTIAMATTCLAGTLIAAVIGVALLAFVRLITG